MKVIKVRPCLFAVLILFLCSCVCGTGGEEDVSVPAGGGDDSSSPADDSDGGAGDDSVSVIDDFSDDSSDDASDDDEILDGCIWGADLPKDDNYEWKIEKVWDLEYGTGGEQGLVFENDSPLVYWAEYPAGDLYLARKNNDVWDRSKLNGDSQPVGSVDMKLSPNGTIGVAIEGNSGDWSDQGLSYCVLEEDEIKDCEGITDDIRGTAVKMAYKYDGRPGLLVKDGSNSYLVYHERIEPGVWDYSYLPTITGDQPYFLAIGPDGEAHYAGDWIFCDPFPTDCYGFWVHFHGVAGQPWGIELLSLDDRIYGIGDMAVSGGNDIIAAAYDYDPAPTRIAHQLRRHLWEIVQISADKAYTHGFRVGYDREDNAIIGYSIDVRHYTKVCFARWEDGLWRKETVESEYGEHYYFENVMDMQVDSDGNVAVLYFRSIWNVDHTDSYFTFAHRVPKQKKAKN